MSGNQSRGLGDHPVIVLLGAVAAIIAIVVFATGKESLPEILNDVESDIQQTGEAIRATDEAALATYYLDRGDEYRNRGDYEQAITNYDKVIELDPNYALAYKKRGSVYSKQGNYEQALVDYQHYLELDPNASDRGIVEYLISDLQSKLNP